MTTVEIKYCGPCGFLPLALETERTLLEEFGRDGNNISLNPGHGGVFEVRVDDDIVWNKDTHGGELDLTLITDAIRERALTT